MFSILRNLSIKVILVAQDVLSWFLYIFDPIFISNSVRLIKLRNKFHGRCVIMGNGPSLSKMTLDWLKNEMVFGANRIYLLFNKMPKPVDFYLSINQLLISQAYEDINKLHMTKIISWKARKFIKRDKDTIFVKTNYGLKFSTNPVWGIWEGATVTYAALQMAYYMGFSEVILIGVDHNFKTKGDPNKIISLTKGDPNHFSKGYFGHGFRWQLPDLETSEQAYNLANKQYRKAGKIIKDATINGKLKVFIKVKYP